MELVKERIHLQPVCCFIQGLLKVSREAGWFEGIFHTFTLEMQTELKLPLSPLSTHTVFSSLQGGIAFVAIKGAFKVYFKQQQYLRQAHRKILNFPEQEEAWGGSAVRTGGQPDEPHTSDGGVRIRTVRLRAGSAGETDLGSVSPFTTYSSLHLAPSGVIHRTVAPPPLHFVF